MPTDTREICAITARRLFLAGLVAAALGTGFDSVWWLVAAAALWGGMATAIFLRSYL